MMVCKQIKICCVKYVHAYGGLAPRVHTCVDTVTHPSFVISSNMSTMPYHRHLQVRPEKN